MDFARSHGMDRGETRFAADQRLRTGHVLSDVPSGGGRQISNQGLPHVELRPDRKSTRLNSSHGYISYAVFCLKKKNAVLIKPIESLNNENVVPLDMWSAACIP